MTVTTRTYGGLSAGERRAARRERLLDAALRTFGTRGYVATTIEQICSVANVTARHFYEEFESREALLTAIFDEIVSDVMDQMRDAIFAPGKAPRAIVADGVAAYFESVTADPRRARIMVLEVIGVSPKLEAHRRRALAQFVREVVTSAQRLLGSRTPPTIDLDLLGTALVGAGQELTTEWVLAEERPSVAVLIELLSKLWMRSLELERNPVETPEAQAFPGR